MSKHYRPRTGALWCAGAALAYTVVNIFMRRLAELDLDNSWIIACRETTVSGLAAVWIAFEALRGRFVLPSRRILGEIAAVGVLIEVVGNLSMQWAFGVVGLAVSVPAVFGTSIALTAVLGHVWLGERITRRSACAIGFLFVSLILLGIGVEAMRNDAATSQTVISSTPLLLGLGVAAAGLAGATFALLNVTIRHAMTQAVHPALVAFLIPFTGVVSLPLISFCRFGMQSVYGTGIDNYLLIGLAGIFNVVGFVAFINGLRRTSAAHANMISASQVALAALAGVILFRESPNLWLLSGIALAIAGIMTFDRPIDGEGL